ncbi:MAG TPA: alkaline phosphatase D family protein, partial [Chitinophagales bacterium]|nr:alkaline phosphatase D family protein [Chitinophagales bacterium]
MKLNFALLQVVFTIHLFAQQNFAPFVHGVASGDPLPDRVILWTRVSPADTTQPVVVNWRIASDSSFNAVVSSGSFVTDASRDFTVKVDATGLLAGTTYFYDFETDGNHSATGRTKTAPAGNVSHLRFAVVTCAKYSKGYFNAYGRIGERDDIDAVIHLGDYIYESKDSGDVGRPMLPFARCTTLAQFRTRYAQYHTDPDLVRVRQRHPFINVWDDHETSNNCWQHGSPNFPDSVFALIKPAATQAYFEWIPIREDTAHPGRIYRKFQYGGLLDLIMLDTRREGRMKQVPFDSAAIINDTSRTMLGHEQFNWLISGLDNSSAQWRIIGQQVMMAPALLFGNPLNNDQWDGYPAERAKLFHHIMSNQIENVVVLTGDLHASLANDLPYDITLYNDTTGAGSVGVEFITPAIASSKSTFSAVPFSTVKLNNPYIQYAEFDKNGYLILDVTPGKVQGDFYYVSTTEAPDSSEQLGASYSTLEGTRYFCRTPLSALSPIFSNDEKLIPISPNPAHDEITVELNSACGNITFRIFDLQ